MNTDIFREYDIRGIADTDLTDEVAESIGKAVGTLVKRAFSNKVSPDIVVGCDNRLSSPRLFNALKKGILSTGVSIIFIGEVTTPMLYYSVNKLKAEGGISVTASHNPPEYNGFKVLVGQEAIFGEQIQEIKNLIEKKDFEKGEGEYAEMNIEKQYTQDIASRISLGRKLRVVADAGNGMASDFAPAILEKIGCEVIPLYCKKDPAFPNHPADPVKEENMCDLIATVKKEKADLGFGFDGDSDRIGLVDEKGNLIYGDIILALLSQDLLTRHPGAKIIFEVKCSQALGDWITAKGGEPIMWKTGHSLIKAKMRDEGALLAGEMSGHMFFAENWFGVDDAILAAAKIAEIVSKSGETLSELVSKIPDYSSSPEYRVDFADAEKFAFVEKAKKHFSEKYKTITIDGVRVVFENGWGLIRASNTGPKLILRFEGKSKKDLENIKKIMISEIESFSGKKFEL